MVWSVLRLPAGAQDEGGASVPDPDTAGAQVDQVREEAQALFQAGRIAYEAGRYEEALERFRAAHELTGLPGLLYNVALAADRARFDEEALTYYERFLAEAEPDEATRRQVEARVAGLQRALERRLSEAPPDAKGPMVVPSPAEAAREDGSVQRRSGPSLGASDAEPRDDRGLSGWAWFGIGGGVAVAVGVVLTAILLARGGGDPVTGDHGVVVTTLGAP
jgi:tetratricopeptide (TPR) repeat protein